MSDDALRGQTVPSDTVYAALARQFPPEAHKTLERAGGQTYVPWNLVAERLNVVLGVEHWSFRVVREGFTATECWVLGELSATIRETATVRQQYGCSPIVQGQRETPVDDLLKKAGTDAFKKCAQVLGVALYLTDPEERAEVKAAQQAQKRAGARPSGTSQTRAAAQLTGAPPQAPTCDAAFFTRKWHATVKGTRFEQDDVRAKFMAWYSDNATESLSAWLKDATEEEAETLVATVKDRIEREAQKATA